jgi:hypothetical protein
MLANVVPLLRTSGEILTKSALAVSSMLHNYCRLTQDCNAVPEVREIIRMFEEKLNYNCKSNSDEDHRSILMALKALGNTGNAQQAIPALTRCWQNTEEGLELRVAAIQAFRRMPCSSDQSALLELLHTTTADPELRINAYLMLLQCPGLDLVTQLQSLLQKEDVNQVGSFIWTHLTNIRESSDPSRAELRELLQDLDLRAFDLDARKYSRNTEWSLFSELLNTGGKVDSNVIFSSESFVPRSGMVNLTIDMFGHSVNLLEVGGRVEGVDKLLEGFFNKEDNSLRSKRDVINPRVLDQISRSYNPKSSSDPKASYYLKIFGNEIHYNDFHDLDMSSLKDKVNFFKWLIKMSEDNQVDYTKSVSLLDAALVLPTTTGLPLKLSVDASAVINLQVNGRFDVRQMLANPATIDIDGAVKPSAAVEVSCEMSVDAHVARAGLRMVSSMHTSTVAQGKLSLAEARVLHFDVDMPKDKVEVFSAKSSFYILYRSEEREQRMIDGGRDESASSYDLINPLGVELCGEMSLPVMRKKVLGKGVARFPFTGPASVSYTINKRDTFSKYHVEVSYTSPKNGPITQAKLNINTPGSRTDREIDVTYSLTPREKMNLVVKTPWKKVAADVEYANTDVIKKWLLRAVVDDTKEYRLLAQLDIDAKKYGDQFTPLVELVMPGAPTRSLKGQVFYRDNKKFDIDLQLDNVFEEPVNMKGNIEKVNNKRRAKYDTTIDISSNVFKGKFEGFVDYQQNNGESTSSRMLLTYTYKNGEQQRLMMSHKLRDKSTKSLTSLSMDSAIETTLWPKYNCDLSADYTLGGNTLSFNLDTGFGKANRLKVQKMATIDSNKKKTTAEASLKVLIPAKSVDVQLAVDHKHTSDMVKSSGTLQYGAGKEAKIEVDVNRESERPLKVSSRAELSFPGRKMAASYNVEEKQKAEYHNELMLQFDQNKVEATGVYRMKPRHEVQAEVKIPSIKTININGYLNPDLNDMQAHAEVRYAGQEYSATTNWKLNPRSYSFEEEAQVTIPSRQVIVKTKLDTRGHEFDGEIDVKYDAKNDPTKKVTVTGKMTAIANAPAINIRAEWARNKFVQLEGNGKYETQGWYATKDDLQATLKLSSSFRNFENIMAQIKKDAEKDSLSSTAMVSWAVDKKIESQLDAKKNGWNDLELTWTVATPFNNWRDITLAGAHKLTGRKIDSNIRFSWDRRQIQAIVKGSANMKTHEMDGEVSLTTPFSGFESMSINAAHKDNGRNFNSNAAVSWAPGRKVAVIFTMEHMRQNAFNINNNGELIIQSPWSSLNGKSAWTATINENSINIVLNEEYGTLTGVMKLEGRIQTEGRQFELSGSYSLDTSIPGVKDILLKLDHVHSMRQTNSGILIQWAANQAIDYKHEGKMIPWQLLEVTAKLTTPFRKAAAITLDSKTNKRGQQLTTANEFKWRPNQKVSLDGQLSAAGAEVSGQLRMTSPFKNAERFTINISNGKKGSMWQSHGDIDIVNRRYEIDTTIGWEGTKKFVIDTTKNPSYAFLLDTELSGSPLNFDTKASFEMRGVISPALKLEGMINADNLKDVKSRWTINTPWREMPSAQIVLSHTQQRSRYLSIASFTMPRYKVSTTNEMNLNDWTNFNTKTSLEYNDRKTELSSSLEDSPKVVGRVIFTSPYKGMEYIAFNMNHDGNRRGFKSGADLSYTQNDKITGDVEFSSAGQTISGSARFTSPFYIAERINAEFSHNGKWDNFNNEASVEVGRARFAGSSKFELNGNQMKSSASVEWPLTSKPTTIKVHYNHDGPVNNFKCDASIEVNGQKEGGMDLEFKNADKMTGKLGLNTPFKAARRVEAEFKHDAKKWNNFANEGSLKINNKQYSGSSMLRWYGVTLKVNADLKMPTDQYSFKLNHKGRWDDFSNTANIDLSPEWKYTFESMFKNGGNSINGNAKLDGPQGKPYSINFNHQGNWKNFETKGEIGTPIAGYQKMSGEVKNEMSSNGFTASGTVDTPFFPATVATIRHQGDSSQFDSSASVEYRGKTVSAAVAFQNGRKLEGSASFKSPYTKNLDVKFNHMGKSNYRKFQSMAEGSYGPKKMLLTVDHDSSQDVSTLVQATTPFRGYENFSAKLEHRGNLDRFETVMTVETPFSGYEKYTGSYKHTGGDLSMFTCEARIVTPSSTYGYDMSHSGSAQQFTTTFIIKNAYKGQDVTMTVTHRGAQLTDFTTATAIQYGNKKMDAEVSYQVQSSYYERNFAGSLKINSPYRVLQNLDIVATHKRGEDLKSGMMTVQHNGLKKVDLDYTYTTSAKKNIRITFKEPKMFEFVVNGEGLGESWTGDASFDWERRTKVGVELGVKNQQTGDNVYDRSLSFKTSLPTREVGFTITAAKTAEGKFSQSTEIQWDRDEAHKMRYDLELSSGDYRRKTYDGSLKITSAIVNFQVTGAHVQTPGRRMTTDVSITMDQTLRIQHETMRSGDGTFTETFTLQHPEFPRDVVLKVNSNYGPGLIEGEVDLQFMREAINFKGKLAREGSEKYMASSHLTYPSLRLDAKFNAEITNTRYQSVGMMEFNYMTTRDGVKTMKTLATLDKNNNNLKVTMNTPIKNVELNGDLTAQENFYRVSGAARCLDSGAEYRTELTFDQVARSIDAKFYNPEKELLHAYGRYQRPTAEIKVYRELQRGQMIEDAVLSLSLDDMHLITGKAFLRPDVWTDIKRAYQTSDIADQLSTSFTPVRDSITEEWRMKSGAFRRSMQGPSNAYDKVSDDLGKITKQTARAAHRMYQANEFYVRDAYKWANEQYSVLSHSATRLMRQMNAAITPYMRQLAQYHAGAMERMEQRMNELKRNAQWAANHYSRKAVMVKDAVMPHVYRAVDSTKAAYNKVVSKIMSAYTAVKTHPTVQKVVKTMSSLQPSDMFTPLKQLRFRLVSRVDKLKEKYAYVFEAVEDVWSNLARRQEIADIASFLTAAGNKVNNWWDEYDVEQQVKIWLKDLSKASWKELQKRVTDEFNDYMQLDKNKFTTYEPKNGNYEFQVYVPYDVQKLKRIPKVNLRYYINEVRDMISALTPDGDWSVWDYVYKYKPTTLDYTQWIPPFTAHAVISGSQHYMTFDKKFYEFAGECSYLLARDFINGHFSVVVNYADRGQRKSITVFSGDRQVEMTTDGRLTLDGRPAEMPLTLGEDTTVTREGSLVRINNRHGVSVTCDLPHDRCSVEVSGWYFGKTAGLLGTYDNEPATDLVRSDQTVGDSVESMAESWVVGTSRCRRATNYASNIPAQTSERRYAICQKYFQNDDSPFRPCFKQLSPEPFMKMCLNDLSTGSSNRMPTDEDICNSASFYTSECKALSINIRLPSMCVRCSLPSGAYFHEGEVTTLNEAEVPRSADVVFVIQHAACNKGVVDKLTDIIDDIDKAFAARNLGDVRYGVVGFGGRGVLGPAHTHTMDGQVLNTRDRVLMGITDFDFEAGNDGDVMAGVRFAAKYPFRTGASKSIVLLPCDACREGEVRYTELQQLLIERDLKLHMIMDHSFPLRGGKSNKSPKTAYIFGVDKDGVFTHKHVNDRELAGDRELRNQVAAPKDLCAALTEVTDGTVFSAPQMTNSNPAMQKKLVDVMVRLWAKKAEPSSCQVCDCIADNVGVGMSVCHHCEMRSPIFDILPQFADEYDDYEDEDLDEEESTEVSAEGDVDESQDFVVDFEEPKKKGKKFGRNRNKNRKNKQKEN